MTERSDAFAELLARFLKDASDSGSLPEAEVFLRELVDQSADRLRAAGVEPPGPNDERTVAAREAFLLAIAKHFEK